MTIVLSLRSCGCAGHPGASLHESAPGALALLSSPDNSPIGYTDAPAGYVSHHGSVLPSLHHAGAVTSLHPLLHSIICGGNFLGIFIAIFAISTMSSSIQHMQHAFAYNCRSARHYLLFADLPTAVADCCICRDCAWAAATVGQTLWEPAAVSATTRCVLCPRIASIAGRPTARLERSLQRVDLPCMVTGVLSGGLWQSWCQAHACSDTRSREHPRCCGVLSSLWAGVLTVASRLA